MVFVCVSSSVFDIHFGLFSFLFFFVVKGGTGKGAGRNEACKCKYATRGGNVRTIKRNTDKKQNSIITQLCRASWVV